MNYIDYIKHTIEDDYDYIEILREITSPNYTINIKNGHHEVGYGEDDISIISNKTTVFLKEKDIKGLIIHEKQEEELINE
ncbi:hypothetical protein [Methanobrevibacter sp. DSM 116169]|uniref:hypothetical protein n=1 Tax=Methanobrevibacter sp. DSM 116169 TaxID=3242727 RepID=UPI0038FCF37D